MLATLSPKGQIVLPVAMRRRLRLDPGATVDIEERAECVIIRAVGHRPLPPPRGTAAQLLDDVRSGCFAPGLDVAQVEAAYARRASSRALRP